MSLFDGLLPSQVAALRNSFSKFPVLKTPVEKKLVRWGLTLKQIKECYQYLESEGNLANTSIPCDGSKEETPKSVAISPDKQTTKEFNPEFEENKKNNEKPSSGNEETAEARNPRGRSKKVAENEENQENAEESIAQQMPPLLSTPPTSDINVRGFRICRNRPKRFFDDKDDLSTPNVNQKNVEVAVHTLENKENSSHSNRKNISRRNTFPGHKEKTSKSSEQEILPKKRERPPKRVYSPPLPGPKKTKRSRPSKPQKDATQEVDTSFEQSQKHEKCFSNQQNANQVDARSLKNFDNNQERINKPQNCDKPIIKFEQSKKVDKNVRNVNGENHKSEVLSEKVNEEPNLKKLIEPQTPSPSHSSPAASYEVSTDCIPQLTFPFLQYDALIALEAAKTYDYGNPEPAFLDFVNRAHNFGFVEL
uniref:Uncharacterized protein n=1 Tax=Caenorhabditis japonica TaxID=281687 RepID=A0A8R1DNF7_CAEJA